MVSHEIIGSSSFLFTFFCPPHTHLHSKSVALHMAFKKTGQYHI